MNSFHCLLCFCVVLSILNVFELRQSCGEVRTIKLINKPKTAVKYKLLKEQDLQTLSKKNNNIPSNRQIKYNSNISSQRLFVRLYTKDGDECGTKLIVEKSETRHKKNREDCIIRLDWSDIKCGSKTTSTTPAPHISRSINTASARVGQEINITCTSRYPIIQKFPNDNQSIIYPLCPSANPYNCRLTFNTWEVFDVDTTLTSWCTYTTPQVKTKTKSTPNTALNMLQYTSDKLVNYDCSHHKNYTKYVNATLLRNNTTLKIFQDYRVERTFSTKENGSILSCYVFVNKDTSGTRFFYNKTMLIYEENYDVFTVNKDWMIGVGAVVVAIIIIIISLSIMKYIKKTKRRITPDPDAKEATNTNPDQVIYANLNALQKQDQNSPLEESPYATTMSSDGVIYAQLDLQNSNRRPEVTESPYAQVFVSGAHGHYVKR